MSKNSATSMREFVASNATKECNYETCTDCRCKGSQYCSFHYHRHQRWNDPLFSYPQKETIEYYRKLAQQIVKANKDHPAIEDATNKLGDIVFECARKESSISRHALRLTDGFNKYQAFQKILTFWLFASEHGLRVASVHNEIAVRDALLGNALLTCAPLTIDGKAMKYPSGRVRKYFGEFIVKELGTILIAIKEKVATQKALEKTAREAEEKAEQERIELHYPQRIIKLAHKVLEQELKTTNKLNGEIN